MNLERTLTSNEVAEMVNRRHDQVLRDIENIIKHLGSHKSVGTYFLESNYKNSQNKVLPNYLLTKKGCELYGTRMNGEKGTLFAVNYIDAFNQMEQHIKQDKPTQPADLETKRMNAEARLENAKVRKAKLLSELAKTTTSDVNKVLLEDKAVEVLTGKKMLEMPAMKEKLYDCKEIAKKLGILSKSGNPHDTAVSQIIKNNLVITDDEFEILPEAVGGWSGSVVKYTQSVTDKLEKWLEDNNYPSVIQGVSKKYHVAYQN